MTFGCFSTWATVCAAIGIQGLMVATALGCLPYSMARPSLSGLPSLEFPRLVTCEDELEKLMLPVVLPGTSRR